MKPSDYQTGTGREQVGLRPTCGVWVLAFMQERFHNINRGDFENRLLRLGMVKQRKDLKERQSRGKRRELGQYSAGSLGKL